MDELIPQGALPWALAAGMVSVHAWYITRPVIKLWRRCEDDKQSLRAEHRKDKAEMQDRIDKLESRLYAVENGHTSKSSTGS